MNQIAVARDVREENWKQSEALRERFEQHHLRVIGLLGSPGSGKTTLLENILPELTAARRVAVIEGDIATENDANRIRKLGVPAVQINTNGACHLDAGMVETALEKLNLADIDLLIVENVGNLVCPVGFPLGETLRLAVISTAEGEDKPLKYPSAALHTDAVIITKVDLAQYVHADANRMAANVRQIKPDAKIFFSGYTDSGAFHCISEDASRSLARYLLG